jgi:DNA-binding HxlR family transcriptional regulator
MLSRNSNQNCPIARALDVLGEPLTLLILRELVGGARRYSDLRAELPGIATNLLAERLKALHEAVCLVAGSDEQPPHRGSVGIIRRTVPLPWGWRRR